MDPKRILIIRFSSLGDVVLATAVLSAIKKKFPESAVTFLTKKEYAEILEGNPNLAAVIGLTKEELGITELAKLAENFHGKYDLIIDLHANLRSFLIRAYSGIEAKVYRKAVFRRRSMVAYALLRGVFPFFPKANNKEENVIKNYFRALRPLGINYNGELPEVTAPEIKQKPSAKIIGIHAGGKQNTKRWPAEKFAEIADYYSGKGIRVILFGDVNDKEINSKIVSLVKNRQNITDLSGKTSFKEMVIKIKECSVFVTNDSAPAHIAAAVKTPAVVVFCATTPKFGFAIRAKNNKFVNIELPCKPCSLHGGKRCWKGTFECANAIKASEVIDKIAEVLVCP